MQYKFRGKRIDNGRWTYGQLVTANYEDINAAAIMIVEHNPTTGFSIHSFKEVIPETVGMWTGLLDKYKQEIYPGDIVKWDDKSNGKYWRFAVVKTNPDIQFDCSEISELDGINNSTEHVFRYGNFIYTDTHNHLSKIGSIHD